MYDLMWSIFFPQNHFSEEGLGGSFYHVEAW